MLGERSAFVRVRVLVRVRVHVLVLVLVLVLVGGGMWGVFSGWEYFRSRAENSASPDDVSATYPDGSR